MEYWEAYLWERGRTKVTGERFKWKAACRTRETKYGAKLRWFYIQPVGNGRKAHYRALVEDNAPTSARDPKRMSDLQPAEKAAVMSVKSYAAPLEALGQRIKRYDRIERAINNYARGVYAVSAEELEKRIGKRDRIGRSIIESARRQGWEP